MNKQYGLGLPEVLISLVLATIIMSALINQYVHAKHHYKLVRADIEKTFELQLVTDLIRDSVHRAGFTPCLGINHLDTMDTRNNHRNIQAFEVDEGRQHSLTIRRMSEYFNLLLIQLSPTQLLATDNHRISHDRPLLVADCYHAEVLKVSRVKQTDDGQIITLAQPLTYIYQGSVYIGEWLEERYFIHLRQQGKAALFYQQFHTDELSADVHTMAVQIKKQHNHTLLQFEFGLDKDGVLRVDAMVRTP